MTSFLVTEQAVREALKEVIDPELGVSIVDLGLLYGIEVDGGHVRVDMTLTTAGCPLHASMAEAAAGAVRMMVPGVEDVDVQIVWTPSWTPERVTEEGRKALGWR